MLKEFVDRIVALASVERFQIHGLEWADRTLQKVTPPTVDTITIHTLTGLVDLLKVNVDALRADEWVLCIDDHLNVRLLQRSTDAYGRRSHLIHAVLRDGEIFPFGKFVSREEFVIGLQSRFVPDANVDEVLRLASSLESSVVALSEDDGISQKTTVKQGIALKEQVTVKGRVRLRPYRTFREVVQPQSEFIFRLRSSPDGGVPSCALFEADGGTWRLDAVLEIKTWLEAQGVTVPVVA